MAYLRSAAGSAQSSLQECLAACIYVEPHALAAELELGNERVPCTTVFGAGPGAGLTGRFWLLRDPWLPPVCILCQRHSFALRGLIHAKLRAVSTLNRLTNFICGLVSECTRYALFRPSGQVEHTRSDHHGIGPGFGKGVSFWPTLRIESVFLDTDVLFVAALLHPRP